MGAKPLGRIGDTIVWGQIKMIRGPILQDSFAILAKEFYSIDPLSVSGGEGESISNWRAMEHAKR